MTLTAGQIIHMLAQEYLEDPENEEKGRWLLKAIRENPIQDIGEVRRQALYESTAEIDETVKLYREGELNGVELMSSLLRAGVPDSLVHHCQRAHGDAVNLSRCLKFIRTLEDPKAQELVTKIEKDRSR